MKKVYIIALVFFVIATLMSGLILTAPMSLGEKLTTGQLMIGMVLSIGAAIIYLMAFKAFWRRLKIAYGFICAAILMLALGTMQFFVLAELLASDIPIMKYGVENITFIIMMTFLYVGTALFAKLVAARSFLTNIPAGMGVALAISVVIAAFFPVPGLIFNTPLAGLIFETVLLAFASFVVYQSMQVVGPLYIPALRGLLGYLALACIGTAASAITPRLFPLDHWINASGVTVTPYLIGGVCIILSAIAFNRIAYAERSPAKISKGKRLSSVDVVMYTASLASSPISIDPALDKVRDVTARQEEGKQLSAAQQTTMGQVYLEIEKFLTTKEPVRKFVAADLRDIITERYKYTVDELNFWNTLEASPPQNAPSK